MFYQWIYSFWNLKNEVIKWNICHVVRWQYYCQKCQLLYLMFVPEWYGWNHSDKDRALCVARNVPCCPTGKNTQFHQELQRYLVITPKISVHLRRKSEIYISALCMLHYGLVYSVAPKENFATLTMAPKFQRNGFTETSSATDGFFSSQALLESIQIGAPQMFWNSRM